MPWRDRADAWPRNLRSSRIPWSLRQIPVIECRKRRDTVAVKCVEEPVVEIEAFRIWRACSFGKHARPRDRKSISLDSQRLDQANVVLVAVVMITRAGRIAVIR